MQVHHISQITFDDTGEFAYLGSPYNRQIWKVQMSERNTVKKTKKLPELTLA